MFARAWPFRLQTKALSDPGDEDRTDPRRVAPRQRSSAADERVQALEGQVRNLERELAAIRAASTDRPPARGATSGGQSERLEQLEVAVTEIRQEQRDMRRARLRRVFEAVRDVPALLAEPKDHSPPAEPQ